MNKYGVENFIVEELEYVKDENILSERGILDKRVGNLWLQRL